MGGRATACSLDISNHTSQVNRGDPLFNDLWSQSGYSSRDWLPNAEDKFFQSEREQWIARKKFRFYWRKKRKCNGPIGILLTQAQARLWCQCEAKTVSAWKLGVEKGSRYCKEPSMGKAGAQLGRAISHHFSGWYRSIFPRRPKWTCNTTPLECKQPEKVLLLMKIPFVMCSFIV